MLFSWVGATEREDNTPYTPEERHGYNILILKPSDPPPGINDTPLYVAIGTAPVPNEYSIEIDQLGAKLAEGDYLFYVQDEDTEGRKSEWSPEPAAFTVVIAAPKPPTGLSVS